MIATAMLPPMLGIPDRCAVHTARWVLLISASRSDELWLVHTIDYAYVYGVRSCLKARLICMGFVSRIRRIRWVYDIKQAHLCLSDWPYQNTLSVGNC